MVLNYDCFPFESPPPPPHAPNGPESEPLFLASRADARRPVRPLSPLQTPGSTPAVRGSVGLSSKVTHKALIALVKPAHTENVAGFIFGGGWGGGGTK